MKIPPTDKIELVAEDMELQSFHIDEQQIYALIKFGIKTDDSFNTFDLRQFGINYQSLDLLLKGLVDKEAINKEFGDELQIDISGLIDKLKKDIMTLILSLHYGKLINLPEKVSQWQDPPAK